LVGAEATPNGWTLRWRAVVEADAYRVDLRDASSRLVLRLGPVADTTLAVSRGRFPKALPSPVFYQVIALREGRPVARSRPVELPRLPRTPPDSS
jgi:hypothetical protein